MGSKPDMMYIAGSGALVGRDSICLSMFFGIPLVSLD
jgi:hypothetical protein